MEISEEINLLVIKIKKLHIDDPKIYDFWEEMALILSDDLKRTIAYIDSISTPELASNVASVFEEVAFNFQSEKFIDAIERLQDRIPESKIGSMIDAAKNSIN